MTKRKVLIMADWFEPGFKAGGPIRSTINFVDHLENDLDLFIFTTDRDLGDHIAYPGIQADCWLTIGQHKVFYSSPSFLGWKAISSIINEVKPDYIYLNSMFSTYFTIFPMVIRRIGRTESKIILAPRGMLKDSALAHKANKKKIFISLFKLLGFSKTIKFHVTDETEELDVVRTFGDEVVFFRAGNLPGQQKELTFTTDKVAGALKIVFIGRIHPIKNLDFLLRALQGINGKVKLTIIATLEDQDYWTACQKVASSLPEGINITLIENLPHEKIETVIKSNHILALPTKGENFGHAIFESLAAGRPVLISDQTPWRNLQQSNAGWDISLANESDFRMILQELVEMDQETLNIWCKGAWHHANCYLSKSEAKQTYLNQFI